MKLYHTLLLVSVLAAGMASCNKGNNAPPITGKWQQTKIRLYELDSNVILYDTTYLHPFSNLDYAQFNANGTCNLSTDEFFYPNEPGEPKTAQAIAQSIGTSKYTSSGSIYILNSTAQLANPGGFYVTDTASVSGNTLLIHVTSYGHGTSSYRFVSDSYYER